LARRAGISHDEIARLKAGADGWSRRERVVLRAVDQLLATKDLDDGGWEELRGYLDEREAIELVMLVGHYDMLATAIATLRIAPDPPRR
jgi:alkylhydroperoxidase family enzyme